MNTGVLRPAVVLLLLGATLAATHYSDRRRPDTLAEPLASIPYSIAGWNGKDDPPLTEGTLEVLKPTSYLARSYTKAGAGLNLFISYYDQQRSGESMHSPKACLPANGWEIWKTGLAFVPVNAAPIKINQFSIEHNGERAVVLYWYQSRKQIIASEYLGKILLVRDALVTGRTAGSIVRLTVADTPEAIRGGMEFASLIVPEVRRCFGH